MKRYLIIIKGNVQRVGFRNYASQSARKLGLTGNAVYIDNDIKIEVQGPLDKIKQFIDWCQTGPNGTCIENMEMKEEPLAGYTNFEIIHGIYFTKSNIGRV